MKKLISTICAGLILSAALLTGCVSDGEGNNNGVNPPTPGPIDGKNITSKGKNLFLMHTTATIVVFDEFEDDENVEKFETFINEANRLLQDIEKSISATVTTSYVSKFNNAAAGAEVQLDEHAYRVMSIAKNVYELTDGYYNPAVYYSVQAYGFNGGANNIKTVDDLPAEAEISKYVELSEYFSEVELKEENGKYYAVKPNRTVLVDGKTLSLKVDLGGVGKGYSVDLVDGLFNEYGYTMGYFNFGSSSMSFKKYKDGSAYNISGTDPRFDYVNGEADDDDTYFKLAVSDNRLSTSGDYEQFFTLGNTVYCHVFDPTTGRPVQTGVMTATIVGGSAAEDDALTTAIMAMGAERAINFIENKIPERQVIFAYDSGASGYKYYTNMADGSYTITDSKYSPLK